MTSLLTFGALSTIATPFTPEYVALAALLALVVGGVRAAIGLLRGGVVAYLMSNPMLKLTTRRLESASSASSITTALR